MRFFISSLTIYTYPDADSREKLNREEVQKFMEGMKFAGEFDRGVLFSDYSQEEIETLAKSLSAEEKKLFLSLLHRIASFKWIKLDLTEYEESYEKMKNVIEDIISSHITLEDLSIKLNLSCGHKIGSLALYLATMQVIHLKEYYPHLSARKNTKLFVDAYHAEKGVIEKLPVMNFDGEMKKEWDSLLSYLTVPQTLQAFKKSVGDVGDKILMYFKKHGYIEMRGERIYLTKRGRTLARLLKKIKRD